MKNLQEILDILESKNIGVDEYTQDEKLCGYELNTYTDGGVNQIIFLDFRESGDPLNPADLIAKFSERIKNIDIDDEIIINRQDDRYTADFTLTQSLKDFKRWKKALKRVKKLIKE